MSNATNNLENKLIDHIFRTAVYVKPAALWVGLYTTPVTDDAGGTEVTGGGYARVNLPPGDANWTATQGGTTGASSGSSGATANAIPITFPAPTADWGTVTYFRIFDAAVGGAGVVFGPLAAPRVVLAGDPAPRFPPGTLQVIVS